MQFLGVNLDGALLVFGAGFALHGLSVLSYWGRHRGWFRGWWLGQLILPVLLPQLMLVEASLLAAIGFVDNWFDLRRAGPAV